MYHFLFRRGVIESALQLDGLCFLSCWYQHRQILTQFFVMSSRILDENDLPSMPEGFDSLCLNSESPLSAVLRARYLTILWARVGCELKKASAARYNHLVSCKREWNGCFLENNPEISLISIYRLSDPDHYFPFSESNQPCLLLRINELKVPVRALTRFE